MIEGLGIMLTGLWGSGVGLSCYSQNISVISIIKVLIETSSLKLIYFSHPTLENQSGTPASLLY